ncbi:MAG: JAB domain-containing protein [Clostridiaceae bacterium]|nr:JAB domain-containing protein [Clostridiaceae bacterium]
MLMYDDERRLAELFMKVARIPKEKLDRALIDNNIRDILRNPALLEPTPGELDRILLLQEFRKLYSTLDHFEKKYQIRTPTDAVAFLQPTLADREFEIVVGLMLDTRNNVIKQMTIGEGTLDSAVIQPRKLAKDAILYNAKSVILAHNHPSGDSNPSQDDINTTKQFTSVLSGLGIMVMDHIVIGKNSYSSLKEMGVFPDAGSIREDQVKYRAAIKARSTDDDPSR